MKTWSFLGLCSILVLAAIGWDSVPARASDHADPSGITDLETDITDLFFFPDGDRYVLILDVRPSLVTPGPYDLSGNEFMVYMDLDSKVTFDNAADRARYGGTVVSPGGIGADVTISLQLNDDASLKEKKITGLTGVEGIRIWTGVRDDPFIFPSFFKKNVIAMVLSIPAASFPPGQQDWLLWATTHKDGKQIDHVGRSIRTQLPRYTSLGGEPFVNDLPPSEHVPAIMKVATSRNKVTQFLMKYKQTAPVVPLWTSNLALRAFDPVPEVMVFTTRFPPGYPNGRRLEDDVVYLTCQAGDCLLQDGSLMNGAWPRATQNDKAFLPDFPYLADPWPTATPPPPAKSIVPLAVFLVLALLLVLSVIPFWIGYRLGRRRRAAA